MALHIATSGSGAPVSTPTKVAQHYTDTVGGIAYISTGTSSSADWKQVSNVSQNGGYIGVKGADIASASTTDLATATGDWVDVTGTTTITALGTVTVGVERLIRFTGILTLTHNGTSLILPTGANITTAAGDTATFRSLGSGNWLCVAYQRADGTPLAGGGGGGLTNFTEAVNTSAPNATVPVVSLTATNAASNVDAAFIPKGTGAILAVIPDNTTTGGEKRGTNAVDLQMVRASSQQVASGATSVVSGGTGNRANSTASTVGGGNGNFAAAPGATVSGGYSNTANGNCSIVSGGQSNVTSSGGATHMTICGGLSNQSTGNYTFTGAGQSNQATGNHSLVVGGQNNVASGVHSAVLGGLNNTAEGEFTTAMGTRATPKLLQGAVANASGRFAADGDAQTRTAILRAQTTNATPRRITTNDADNDAGVNNFTLSNNQLCAFTGEVVVRQNATGDSSAWRFDGAVKRGASEGTTALVGTPTITLLGQDAGAATWTFAITVDTSNGSLRFDATGEASHTLNWVARVRMTEVTG